MITITGAAYGKKKDETIGDGLRYSSAGNAFLNFKVAAYGGKDKDGDKKDKVYWNCVAFGDLAENIAASVEDGDSVIVHGHVESNNWTDNDGNKRYDTQVMVREAGLSLRWNTATAQTPNRSDGGGGGWAGTVPAPTANDTDDTVPF